MLQLLKPEHLEPVLRNERSPRSEKLQLRSEEQPLLAQLEKAPNNKDPA